MAWKMRKDKLKAGDDGEPTATEADPAAPPADAPTEAADPPVFDLSGSAFQPPPAPADDEPDLPQFFDEAPASPAFAPASAPEPIALGTAPPLSDELEPLPEFDPAVAPSDPAPEPDAIALAPPTPEVPEAEVAEVPEAAQAEEDEPVAAPIAIAPVAAEEAVSEATYDEEPEISPEREALAAGLVSTDTDTGLPRVAPFILDTPPPAPEAPRMHTIVMRIGRMSANYFLTKDVTTIGRPDSLVQNYPDIEVEMDDGVSRRHAEIRHDGEGYTITDVGSTNGTLLNGAPLTPHETVILQEGDRIRVGERTELLFE